MAISPTVLSRFSRQFVMLYHTGIPILAILETLAHQAEDVRFGFVLLSVRWSVRNGRSLAGALALYPDTFPSLYVALVRAGESSGKLAHTLEYAARITDAEIRLTRQVQAALTYPVMVLAVTLISSALCTWLMLPFVAELCDDVHTRVPVVAQVLAALLATLQDPRCPLTAGFAIVLVTVLLRRHLRRPAIRHALHAALLRFPTVGPLLSKVVQARMMRCLGLCLEAGLPLLQVLELCRGVAVNEVYQRDMKAAHRRLRCGHALSEHMMKRPDLYARAVSYMLAVGEASSTLSRMSLYAADLLEDQAAAALTQFVQLLEPALLLALGLIVAFVALAAFQPLSSLVGSMG